MIDFMSLTPQQVERFIHIQSAVERQKMDHGRVKDYRDYYYGDHPVLLTQRQQEFLGSLLTGSDFPPHHNICKIVVDTLRERLSVSGISVNGSTPGEAGGEDRNADIAAMMWDWWKMSRLDSQQARQYRRMLRDGKAYVMVDYDSVQMRPRIKLHKLDDGVSGIVVHRDPEDPDTILFANRYFYSSVDPAAAGNGSALSAMATTGVPRKTVYLPHEIRKYAMHKAGEWQPHLDPGDAVWPIPWVDAQGQPLGINVFASENAGGSELDGIIGFQNSINKSWLDVMAAQDMSGFPLLVIENNEENLVDLNHADDANLEGDDEIHIAPGRAAEVWDASVKRIDAADLSSMTDAIWALTMAVSSASKVPHQQFRPFSSTANLSGETLKQIEAPLLKKIADKQLELGQFWEDVFRFAYKLETVFGSASDELESIAVLWDSPELQDDKANAETAQIHKDLGIPDSEIHAMLGYTPEQVAGFTAQARQEQAVQIANIAGAIRASETRATQQVGEIENG